MFAFSDIICNNTRMNVLVASLPYAQIVLSVVLVLAIMLQQTSSNVGGALGGDDAGGFHHTRRGFEKFLFYLSIVCGILFALLALGSIYLKAKGY